MMPGRPTALLHSRIPRLARSRCLAVRVTGKARFRMAGAVSVLVMSASAAGLDAASVAGRQAAVDSLLAEYRLEAVRPFQAEAGERAWYRKMENGRSCTSCHTQSLEVVGRHQKTGKAIEPMAPSVNPDRLTRVKKIRKWFLRNCKWTYGRECTAQEKGDMLVWLSRQ